MHALARRLLVICRDVRSDLRCDPGLNPERLRRKVGAAGRSLGRGAQSLEDLVVRSHDQAVLCSHAHLLHPEAWGSLVAALRDALQLLHLVLLLPCGTVSRAAALAGWTPTEAAGVDAAVHVVWACLRVAVAATRAASDYSAVSADALAALQSISSIAACRPGAVLASATLLHGRRASALAAASAAHLLQLVCLSEPFAAALLGDVRTSTLLDSTCDRITAALSSTDGEDPLTSFHLLVASYVLLLHPESAVLPYEPCVPPSAQALLPLFGSSAFWRMLLAGLAAGARGALPSVSWKVLLIAACDWLNNSSNASLPTTAGMTSRAAWAAAAVSTPPLGMTPQHLVFVLQAAGQDHTLLHSVHCLVVHAWPHLSTPGQKRTFAALLQLLQQVVDTALVAPSLLLPPATSPGSADPGTALSRGTPKRPQGAGSVPASGAAAAVPGGRQLGGVSFVLHLMLLCTTPGTGLTGTRGALRRCATSVLLGGSLPKLEALLRRASTAAARSPVSSLPSPLCQSLATWSLHLATFTALGHTSSCAHARTALAVLHSLAATVRKLYWVSLRRTSAGQSPSRVDCALAGGAANPDTRATPGVSASPSISLDWLDDAGCPLQSHRVGGLGAAAVEALRCCTAQGLPPVIRAVTLRLSGGLDGGMLEDGCTHECTQLLSILALLHEAGLADETAAAGAPALLHLLFLAAISSGGRDSSSASLASSQSGQLYHALADGEAPRALLRKGLALAVDSSGWRHELQRLDVVRSARLLDLSAPVETVLLRAPEDGGLNVPPSWDACLLTAAARPPTVAAAGNASSPFFGCWHRRCTNFSGASEAALPLRKCGGCGLAQYCSQTCQRQAWRSGHRAACQAWSDRSALQSPPPAAPPPPSSLPAVQALSFPPALPQLLEQRSGRDNAGPAAGTPM